MQKGYYLDTCIWRDYFENRADRLRPIGDWAFSLIRQIIENEDIVVYSDVVEGELLMDYNSEEVLRIISIIPSSLLLKLFITKKTSKRRAYPLKRISNTFERCVPCYYGKRQQRCYGFKRQAFFHFT